MGTQFPIEAGPNDEKWCQPEPDVHVLLSDRDFKDRHPFGHELLLAAEVADGTLAWDCGRKREIYAHAGVPEYWVVDLEGRQLLVFRNLQNDAYTESLTLSETDLLPHIGKPVAELL